MRVKKFKNNEYVKASDDIWIRNLCSSSEPVDVNSLSNNEISLFLNNEYENFNVSGLQFDDLDQIYLDKLIICSDGHGWSDKQKILGKISNKIVKIIGVNGSLSKWEMVGDKAEVKRTMTFYLVNNPYSECVGYLPKKHKYYPNLIASTKTNPKFFKDYQNQPFFYKSSQDLNYSGVWKDSGCLTLDDYRNPICAAISFAWKKRVKKLALFCCDEAFEEKKPGSVRMRNGLYQYPQQILCQSIIDKQLYWLKKAGVEVVDCSSGADYENAEYIDAGDLLSFFTKDET